MRIVKFVKTAVVALGAVAGMSAVSAHAGVSFIGSQAAFSAAGTISQNTNWDSYGSGFTYPGSPFTVGNLTFNAGGNTIIGGVGTSYNLARNLISDSAVLGTTADLAGAYTLFGANAGNFLIAFPETFNVQTNLASYNFYIGIGSAVNLGALTFVGFEATGPGEYIQSVGWNGGGATGLTDIQIGTVGTAVPELSTWAMMLFGFAGVGFVGARSSRRNAVPAA